tara:strand:- start:795 stop:1406 length:612 start_codon:yes stop_codon:yes gene_type:complete
MNWFDILKQVIPDSWSKPTPEQKKIIVNFQRDRGAFWDLQNKIANEVVDYFKEDLPLDVWIDTNTGEMKKIFGHWFVDLLSETISFDYGKALELTSGSMYYTDIVSFLKMCGELGTHNSEIMDQFEDLAEEYENRSKEIKDNIKTLREEEEKRKKESEWQKTLSIARQWGIKPNWRVEQNKDIDGLKEQLPPAARKKLEEKLQ